MRGLRADHLRQTITTRIRQVLQDRQSPPTLTQMAAELCMTERSLSRRLNGESTSYQRLVDQHRERHAREKLINSQTPIQQIAVELGYTNPANFTRAFRKWTGMTPQELRLRSGN